MELPATERTVLAGREFTIVLERVTLSSGEVRDVAVIRHPGSVVILALPAPHKVILVRQYRVAVRQWLWEVPAGTRKPGEDPEAAARRECEEEIQLTPGRLERLGAFLAVPGYGDEEMIFYRATDLTEPARPALPDEDEEFEVRTFGLADARSMVRRGEIADMKSALALTFLP
jgi:ADP-ribose pyrophosphatase